MCWRIITIGWIVLMCNVVNSQHLDKVFVENIIDDGTFKKVVNDYLINGDPIFYQDTVLFIKRLISVYSNDESASEFRFINTPFTGRTTRGDEIMNCSIIRRVDYTILAYIHFFVLEKDTFDKTKTFRLLDKNLLYDGRYDGIYAYSESEKDKYYRMDSKVIKSLYKDFMKWIVCIRKNGVGINNAECEYPFDKEIKWSYTPMEVE
ncbi:MAG: hypothetical protein JEZ03_18380 [Bacteroidales bacterium]|nr:hypothetical protein [Bacteroidales bacterium]